jgi:hypothetical protein
VGSILARFNALRSWLRIYRIELILIAALAVAVGYFGYLGYGLLESPEDEEGFSGEQALQYALRQTEFGPRVAGTPANLAAGDWLIDELGMLGWNVYIQPFEALPELEARNILAVQGSGPSILLATHYDTRALADRDPDPARRQQPGPGANDGASGVGTLLALARSLDPAALEHEICLVFFDAESNRGLEGWESSQGSRLFVSSLPQLPRCSQPELAIVLNLVGSEDPLFVRDGLGDALLVDQVWQVAEELGYGEWFSQSVQPVNHETTLSFIQAEIPTFTLADVRYPHRHTAQDTPDQLSLRGLGRVGAVLHTWLSSAPLGAEE